MWAAAVETLGALVARLTQNTPPAAWLPFAGYAFTAIGASLIAAGTLAMSRSRLATAAVAIAFIATPAVPDHGRGALLITLAVLGLLFTPHRPIRSVILMLLLIVAVTTGSVWIAVWMFAGCGLAVVAGHIGDSAATNVPLRRMAAVVLLTTIVVTARLPAAATSVPPAPAPLGHDRLTAKSFRELVSNIPPGSALVRDDRITGILYRAIRGDLDRAKANITEISDDAATVRATLATKRVFALPYAQQALARQGFQIVDGLRTAGRGLAEVTQGADCIVATHDWHEAPQLAGHTSLSLVAENDHETGPVVLLLSGQEELIHVSPVGWTPRTLRGFSPKSFDLNSRDGVRAYLDASDGDPHADANATGHMLTRVAMWRMPDAPMQMRIDLSVPAPRVVVYLSAEARYAVRVCPVFPAPVVPVR